MTNFYYYPLLSDITAKYSSQRGLFENTYILGCQHVLEPQAKMLELISAFGIPKENIRIFGKIYSMNDEVLAELKDSNFNVEQPSFESTISFDEQHAENCNKEFEVFLASVKSSSKIIILDDGGELLKTVNTKFDSIPKNISVMGIEQTSSGFRKLENSELHFPIFNVARSSLKLIKESPLIATLGCNRMVDVFTQYSIAEPRILVVGLGPMGSNTLSILNNKRYFTLGYDIIDNKTELIDLIRNNNINVLAGVTGSNILDANQLQAIKDSIKYNLYLISMSSSDREFPAVSIRKNSMVTSKIHEDVHWNNLILINNGFPITFKGNRYESTPQEIERTIGLLYGSVLEAITNTNIGVNGFIDVPEKIVSILGK